MAADRVLVEWTFDRGGDREGWEQTNHLRDVRVADGALQGVLTDWDPFVRSPQFEIPARPWQCIQVRLKTDCGGDGQFFWTNTTEGEYEGFMPGKETRFRVIGDGRWHEYTIYPFWQGEERIILVRLDLPRPADDQKGRTSFAVDWIRIVDLDQALTASEPTWRFPKDAGQWRVGAGARLETAPEALVATTVDPEQAWIIGPGLQLAADDGFWACLEIAVTGGTSVAVRWATTESSGFHERALAVHGDGAFHLYNLDLAANTSWRGEILAVGLTLPKAAGATVRIRRLSLGDAPQGPAVLHEAFAGLTEAINRPGPSLPFMISLTNAGGQTATGLRITAAEFPAGVTWADGERELPDIEPFDTVNHRFAVRAQRPCDGRFSLTIEGAADLRGVIGGTMRVDPALGLPPADYVPEPQPVDSDYEIGAFYFPGWPTYDRWERIWPLGRKHKPVLGWYDESNPECADWQIKWAVENGIGFFLVDWYWHKGSTHLDHWLHDAFMKARYRRYLKVCLMWANHNPPGSHSAEDQRRVTQFWLDHYFGMPEYYRINDMPVVMIWSPRNMERDMAGKGGLKRLLAISREMAQAAGYKGIWFVTMKWPEASTEAADVQWLRDAGVDMTSLYHYMHHGGRAEDPTQYPFDLVAESSYPWWRARLDTGILPFLPNLSTGWDSRPWHGDRARVIYGRTPALFRRICEDAKRFADETGIRRLVLAPLNEWGEGSYAEPCREFGFGMYEAVRDTFGKRPAPGWPRNYGPTDVGLGPYDLPMPAKTVTGAWDFESGTQGWVRMMGIGDVVAADGGLRFETSSHDPALRVALGRIKASAYRALRVRMRVTPAVAGDEHIQVFWETLTAGASEDTSTKVPIINDGQVHDYVLPVAANARWRGRVKSLRLDPCSRAGAQVVIEEIRLVRAD